MEMAHTLFAVTVNDYKEFAAREYARAIEGLEMEAVQLDNALQGGAYKCQNTWISPLKTLQILQPKFHFNPAYPNALTISAGAGEFELVRMLLMFGPGGSVAPALHAACKGGHTEIVRLLLETVKPSRKNMRVACQNGHTEIVRLLLETVKPSRNLVDAGNLLDTTHIECACAMGRTEIVRILLTHIEPTPIALYIACKNGHAGVVRLLLHRTDLNMPIIDASCGTSLKIVRPFEIACIEGHLHIVRILLPHVSKPLHLPGRLCLHADVKLIRLLMAYHTFTHNDLLDAICTINYDVVELLKAHVKINRDEIIDYANTEISHSMKTNLYSWLFVETVEQRIQNATLRIRFMIQQSLISPFDIFETIVDSACKFNNVYWIHEQPQTAVASLEYAKKHYHSHPNFKTVVDAILTHIPPTLGDTLGDLAEKLPSPT